MVIAAAILLNLFIIFFETFDISERFLHILNVIEFITVLIFTVEYILRLVTADFAYPKKRFALSVLAFVLSLYGLIDLASFLPYWLIRIFHAGAFPSGVVAFRMLRVVRILRLFRVNRYYDAFNVITDVLKEKKNQILSALFIIIMLVIASSIIMYDLEHEAQPEQFSNAFSGIWWAVSTLLTVGYGDIYPVTEAGRFVGIILAFLGVGIVAIPTGIISAGFVEQYTRIRDLADVSDECPVGSITVRITNDHEFCGKKVRDIRLFEGAVITAILRGHQTVCADADMVLADGDVVVISAVDTPEENTTLTEITIKADSVWSGRTCEEFAKRHNVICVLVKRDGKNEFPDGCVIRPGDVIVSMHRGVGGKM